ncbi:putative methyltransferase-domain-containing protein [Elsinoe ampelina]|uniref:Protein N-terminal and lysine N-methyltransferase EFM7 n=1 Tax=Elsinoe ampelina TaxID=302913 RepID=A0A6A6G3W3_9PEZI|nr:putative methyltransferase-domain-containing protein [Elsinoe ampelina]
MSDSEDDLDLFQEPEDFYEKAKPATTVTHQLTDGTNLVLHLVGHNPLWGHFLWNAGKVISNHIEQNAESLVRDKTVLELGAGAGLPSFTCSLRGANSVVVTDYPDAELIENLRLNIESVKSVKADIKVHACGLLWGADVSEVKSLLPTSDGFDILILADLLFNHSEHGKLIKTIQSTLRRSLEAKALVFFTPYRPWLLAKDLAFFDLARDNGFLVTKILEHVMEKVMFENDPGDELLRRTVFGYEVTWAEV